MRRGALVLLLLGASCGGESREAPAAGEDGAAVAAEEQAPEAEPGSAGAAVAVLRDYYAAIRAGDHARAYAHWAGEGEASGQTLEEFRDGYAETASVRIEVGEPGRIDAAAGSRYISIPVVVRATTTDGTEQAFRGPYVLRRSVVPGATAEQRRWHIASAELVPCDPAACVVPASVGEAPAGVVDLVTRFGGRLTDVSLQAPSQELRDAIRESYEPLVTPDLLRAWLAEPAAAPGRLVSSPWPERIEIERVRRVDENRYDISGDVVYVTSVELARGGAARREPVSLAVRRNADGEWRIAAYSND